MQNDKLVLFEDCAEDMLFEQLISKVSAYHPARDFSLIERAYALARDAHQGQERKSGEPYIQHPLEVAIMLANPLRADRETIAAGILHDVIEDTDYTYEDLKEIFGEEVANLVNGVTKLAVFQRHNSEWDEAAHGKIKTRPLSAEEAQAENYRKMFLAMSDDIRVIMIKIADRLHNLRTLESMPEDKRKRIATESLTIYAPLAGRLGIAAFRREIEDLSFKYSDNAEYLRIKAAVDMKLAERDAFVEEILGALTQMLAELKIFGKVEGRPKHFFSIHRKMHNSNRAIDQIFDLYAVRIIVPDMKDVWVALGYAQQIYKPIPGRFKNYIASPKSNLYQSVHDTLMGPGGLPFEIQVRTWEMHNTAEYGVAAHWKYKEGKFAGEESANAKENWLGQILEWQTEEYDNQEFLRLLKSDLDVYSEYIYCYTPKGKVVELVKGSGPVDFAYAIHSDIGNSMVGAKINGKFETKEYILQNGDWVEIETSKNTRGPSIDWLKIVKTSNAKSKIRQWLRKQGRDESIARGRDILERGAKKRGHTLAALLACAENGWFARFGQRDFDTMCAAIGQAGLREGQVFSYLLHVYEIANPAPEPDIQDVINEINEKLTNIKPAGAIGDIIIEGIERPGTRFAKCCNPLPGDKIIGFVTRGRGVSVHRTDCANIAHTPEDERPRLISVAWSEDAAKSAKANFHADLTVVARDEVELVIPISQTFAKSGVVLTGINARSVGNEAVFNVSINVAGAEQLNMITDRLRGLDGVYEVRRDHA